MEAKKVSKKQSQHVIKELNRIDDLLNAIYGNYITCGNLTELTWHDEEFLSLDIREEDDELRMEELEVTEELKSYNGKTGLYPKEWTSELRMYIKERDRFTCYVCQSREMITPHHVHHIDYDKANCKESNLVTLCPSCHMRTNGNRGEWQQFFQDSI